VSEYDLDCYLKKCELQYRADHTEGADALDWLAPYCDTLKEIVTYLRELGFRIKEVVDDDSDLGSFKWVTTTAGVIVYQNVEGCSRGLFCKAHKS
jgi:hypothetical protein